MKISTLIAIKPDFGWRDYIWTNIRRRYESLMPQLELCIAFDHSEPFWKTRALNRAARMATGEIFLLADSDVVFHPDLIEQIKTVVPRYPWVIPFSEGIRLNEPATRNLLHKGIDETVAVLPKDIQSIDKTPGVLLNAMTRSCFEAVGGLDERFRGWGYEDSALVLALDTICGKHHRISGPVYHLWHPHAGKEWYQTNRELLQPYLDAQNSLLKMKKLIIERGNGDDDTNVAGDYR